MLRYYPISKGKDGIYRRFYSEGIPCAYLRLQGITSQKKINITVNVKEKVTSHNFMLNRKYSTFTARTVKFPLKLRGRVQI